MPLTKGIQTRRGGYCPERRVGVDGTDRFGRSALYLAAADGRTEMARLLIKTGGDTTIIYEQERDCAAHAFVLAILYRLYDAFVGRRGALESTTLLTLIIAATQGDGVEMALIIRAGGLALPERPIDTRGIWHSQRWSDSAPFA